MKPQKKETPHVETKPETAREKGHCGMQIPVASDDQVVYCNGCHTWVNVKKLHEFPLDPKPAAV